MTEPAISYKEFLAELPVERKSEIERVWQLVRKSVQKGFKEQISRKYLMFQADGENYVALANQKNYISLYVTPLYVYPELRAKLDDSGKNCKVGKGCINFSHAEELPLDALAEIIGTCSAEDYKQKLRRVRDTGKPKKRSAKP